MISKLRITVLCIFFAMVAQPVWAENTYTCPDIAKAVKVAECPSEDELVRMFDSTCGSKDTQGKNPHAKGFCTSYKTFKMAKNTALWESADGEYMGYVTCNVPVDKIKAGKLQKISLGQKRVMDRIICSYEGGGELVLRTRETCKIPGAVVLGRYMGRKCGVDDQDCKAVCK